LQVNFQIFNKIMRKNKFFNHCRGLIRLLWVEFRYRSNSRRNDRAATYNLLKQWKSILNESDLAESVPAKKVLFVTGYGLGAHYQAIEPMIISALRARGVSVASLFCDKALPACEFNINGNNSIKVPLPFRSGITNSSICSLCDKCSDNIVDFYPALGVDLYSLNAYLDVQDFECAIEFANKYNLINFRAAIYKGIAVGEEAYSSILRATFKGDIEDTKHSHSLIVRYLVSGVMTAIGYEKAMKSIRPEKVVCIHGIYQTHGLAVKVANKLEIPVVVLGGGGIRKDTVVVCHGVTYHHQLIEEANDVWENKELTIDEREKVLRYALLKRSSGGGVDYLSYHPNPIENSDYIFSKFAIDRSRKIISIYTNVMWDAQVVYKSNVFDNMLDWLWTTIDQLSINEKVWVFIRIHPAEAKGGIPTLQPIFEEIKARYPKLPDNVRIVPPENDLSSYILAQNSHANIIYGTKMGLEIALLKKPLIICGETFSRNKGYGLDINSRVQYTSVLTNICDYSFDMDNAFERAIKYAYYFYFRRMIDLPITTLSSGEGGVHRLLNISNIDELGPGKNKGIDVICDGILNGSPFVLD
jgi:hypothetical protein